ncbi:bifunctional riboflavin kinase/FAD synthetase [Hoylesella oralis]|uniref:bifunctional riboflavin kinase/FAD synthetase n=1 Tax=Hoylesella oralis TaxID=28134 RepID=UPI0028E62B30|nr:bifunctional riboflavin kinase/FAD synthetase [Hoylesella oralis]
MKTIRFSLDNQPLQTPRVATIGFFDGVHRGHQYLIERVKAEAATAQMVSAVITFSCHPRQILHSEYVPELLTTLDGKLIQLAKTKVDETIVLNFDKDMAALSARDFMEKILRDRLDVRKLVIGYDNRFGHNRSEGFEDYARYGNELGIEVIRHPAFMLHGVNVSSSVIRTFLHQGEVEMAALCLGYPYTISGKVVPGVQEGRKIGFPTANLDTSHYGQLIPANGVYAVKARLEQSIATLPAMMNIGMRPTFNGTDITLETHILNFSDDLYGKTLSVSFMHRIREEQKFDSPQDLMKQLQYDRKMVVEQFEKDQDKDE